MSVTITANNGGGVTFPHFILTPYDAAWQGRNTVHQLIGGGIAVTFTPPNPRTGTLELLYLTEADAFAAAQLHRNVSTFTLDETDVTRVSMTYVVTDSIDVHLDQDAHSWIVRINYQEVTP